MYRALSTGLLLAVLLLAACGADPTPTNTPIPAATPTPTASPTPAAPALKKVVIALPNIGIQTMALHTAVHGGFFEAQGLDVTLGVFPTPREVMRAVRLGDVDLAVVPIIQVVNSLSSPRPLVSIGAVSGTTQLNVAVAGAVARDAGLTADSSIEERLGALEGLRLAHPPGPLGANTAAAIVSAGGLANVELVPIAGADQPEALASGLVDAFLGHHPYLEQSIVNDAAVMLIYLTGGDIPAIGAFPSQVLALTPDAIAGHEPTLTAVLAGLAEAQRAINSDPEVARVALVASFPELPDAILVEGVRIYAPGVPTSPEITEAGFEIALTAFGLDPVPFARVVDSSLLPR